MTLGRPLRERKRTSTHWVWRSYSTERGKAFVTEMSGFGSEQQLRMLRGERLPSIPKIVITGVTSGRFPDHLGNYVGILLISSTLRRVLEESVGANLAIRPGEGARQTRVAVFRVNVLDAVPALDVERSKVTRLPGASGIDRILRFVPRSIPDDAPPIFHVAEDPTLILVNDELRRQLEAATTYPGMFVPAADYRNEF